MEREDFSENTPWVTQNIVIYKSTNGLETDIYPVLEKMHERVKISIFPNGEIAFQIPYPFDDIEEEQKKKMINKAKADFPKLKPN